MTSLSRTVSAVPPHSIHQYPYSVAPCGRCGRSASVRNRCAQGGRLNGTGSPMSRAVKSSDEPSRSVSVFSGAHGSPNSLFASRPMRYSAPAR